MNENNFKRKMANSPVVGIRFGHDFVCAQVCVNGSYKKMATERAYVAFTRSGCIVGNEAYEHRHENSANTFYDFATIIGRSCNTLMVKSKVRCWPFHITDVNRNVYFVSVQKGLGQPLSVQYVASLLLNEMRIKTQLKLRVAVTDCVLVVPDEFMEVQKPALISACKQASLNVLCVAKESVASVVGFTSTQALLPKENVLVFDTTTTPFSAFIYSCQNGAFKVKSNVVNKKVLKGAYFQYLHSYFKDAITQKYNMLGYCLDVDVELAATIQKTDWAQNTFAINFQFAGLRLSSELAYATFKQSCPDLVGGISRLVNDALKEARVSRRDVTEIHVVGVSSFLYNRFARKIVREFFSKNAVKICDKTHTKSGCRGAAWLAFLADRNRQMKGTATALEWNIDKDTLQFVYGTRQRKPR